MELFDGFTDRCDDATYTLYRGREQRMPNGKPGDHPVTDILIHNRNIYSSAARDLIREIVALADEKSRRELGDLLFTEYNEYQKPDVAKLEKYLTGLRDQLKRDAKSRGFETDTE